jgi:hypothetical protein
MKGKGKQMAVRNIGIDMRYTVEMMLRRIARSAWCRGCDRTVELLTLSEAARLAATNPANLVLWIKAGRVHCVNARGEDLVCASSIQQGEAVTGELDRHALTAFRKATPFETEGFGAGVD